MPPLQPQRLNMIIPSLKPLSSDSLDDINGDIQKKLREATIRLGWSDLEVANKAGLPQSTVYRLLNAKTANPSFALVLKLCHTLGIALPFSEGHDYPKRPIEFLIGSTEKKDNLSINQEWVHSLPELHSYKIGKIVNDCATHKYPKGALLFFTLHHEHPITLKPKETLIIKITRKSHQYRLLPMMVLENPIKAPDMAKWILHHLTSQKRNQFIVNIDAESLNTEKNGYVFEIFGKVQKAII